MKGSTDRILTTHVGSLPRPAQLLDLYRIGATEEELAGALRAAVGDVVRRQVDAGIDIVNDGEYGKPMDDDVELGAWASYAYGRLSGFEMQEVDETSALLETAEGLAFPGFYGSGAGASTSDPDRPLMLGRCVGPIAYEREDLLRRDIDHLGTALAGVECEEAFLTALSAGGDFNVPGEYYPSADEEAVAIAEALRVEYRAIVDAGFVLQLDNPHLVDTFFFKFARDWDIREFRKWAEREVELVNHALAGIPTDRVRCHMCWGSWLGPHATDLPLADAIDLLLRIDAGAYSIEAANPRHEHEWKLWQDAGLPDGKVLIPGVVSHKTNVVEHPEVVADRIVRYADAVGRENVIAGTDCGMGGRIHPEIAWAKLHVLSEGARLASERLWS